MEKQLQAPLVHSNGTGQSGLVEQYNAAYLAVNEALGTVAQNGPNGRDYYPLDRDAWKRADEQHRWRLARLADIATELAALCNAVHARQTAVTVEVES